MPFRPPDRDRNVIRKFRRLLDGQTAFANTTVQHMRKMPEAQVEELKAHLREHLPRDKSGRIVYKARANAAKGRVPG